LLRSVAITSGVDKLALNGGGRYDGLAELLGGQPTPGIGFGAGIERIIAELKKQGITPPVEEQARAFVVYFGKSTELKEAAVQLVAELRRAGIISTRRAGRRPRPPGPARGPGHRH